jgi:Protein of unknown function (DUF2961)
MKNFACRSRSSAMRIGYVVALFVVLALMPSLSLQAQQRSQPKPARPDGPLDKLFQLQSSQTRRISSADPTGGNSDWIVIPAGETKTLAEIPGAGVIRRFYVAPLAPDRMRYRKVILRMYWDDEKEPSVEVPLGDLFGSGLGTLRYFHSLIVDVNPGMRGRDFDGLVNYFPMPFQKGARITLENDGKVPDFRIWYHIDFEQYPGGVLPPDSGRFHAQWRHVSRAMVREGSAKNTTLGNASAKNLTGEDNFVILDAEGQGTYVGLFLTVDNLVGGWYGEGDDMIFVDGATVPPTYAGTGHEEVFNSGCCPDSEFWGPYTGFYLIQNLNGNFGGKNQMYKFYLNDPVRFQKAIRVTIEHGHANNMENAYTSTAFWYQKEPHKAFPPMPAAQQRLASWPADVAAALEKELTLGQELSRLIRGGNVRVSAEDRKQLQALSGERNKAFQELRHQDFVEAVAVLEALVKRYSEPKP